MYSIEVDSVCTILFDVLVWTMRGVGHIVSLPSGNPLLQFSHPTGSGCGGPSWKA